MFPSSQWRHSLPSLRLLLPLRFGRELEACKCHRPKAWSRLSSPETTSTWPQRWAIMSTRSFPIRLANWQALALSLIAMFIFPSTKTQRWARIDIAMFVPSLTHPPYKATHFVDTVPWCQRSHTIRDTCGTYPGSPTAWSRRIDYCTACQWELHHKDRWSEHRHFLFEPHPWTSFVRERLKMSSIFVNNRRNLLEQQSTNIVAWINSFVSPQKLVYSSQTSMFFRSRILTEWR